MKKFKFNTLLTAIRIKFGWLAKNLSVATEFFKLPVVIPQKMNCLHVLTNSIALLVKIRTTYQIALREISIEKYFKNSQIVILFRNITFRNRLYHVIHYTSLFIFQQFRERKKFTTAKNNVSFKRSHLSKRAPAKLCRAYGLRVPDVGWFLTLAIRTVHCVRAEKFRRNLTDVQKCAKKNYLHWISSLIFQPILLRNIKLYAIL